MTREELEKEAEDFIRNHTIHVFVQRKDSINNSEEKCLLSRKDIYLAGAEPREKRISELEAQIEKMKCCENCAWWYKLPNGQRDCAETCENLNNWSLRRIN